MKMKNDCLSCIFRQTLEAAKMATDDEKVVREILNEYAAMVPQLELEQTSPELVAEVKKIIEEKTGVVDPYKEFKEENIELALAYYPKCKKLIEESEDPLLSSLVMSAMGNSMDAGISLEVKLQENIKRALSDSFVCSDYDLFKQKLNKSNEVLIVADNAGEAVFDKLLIKQLNKHQVEIYYAVRKEPILNDVTLKEAQRLGLDQECKLLTGGSGTPGLTLEKANQQFKKIFAKADLIISKGQGNLEGLSETARGIFFLLKAKCEFIAEFLQVDVGDLVFVFKGENKS